MYNWGVLWNSKRRMGDCSLILFINKQKFQDYCKKSANIHIFQKIYLTSVKTKFTNTNNHLMFKQ